MSTSAGVKQVSIACLANDTDAISLWISQGGAVNSVLDGRGNTPLHVCASSGAVDCMDILLQHGADVTRARGDGFWTPLHEALYNTNLGAAVLLMQAGALVSPANKGSPTPLDVATERCNAFRRALHDDSRTTASTQSNCVTASAVFAFGKDNHQLGFATRGHSGVQFKPKLLTSLPPRVHITALAVSKQHCVAVTSEGDVLSWGCGEFGVLGHGSEANVLFPQRIAALRRKEVKSVAVSQHHSVAMSADGSLYTWGSNAYGQLGAEADDASMEGTSAHPYRARPKRLDLLSSLQVTHVSVGSRHTVAVTREGTVYGFGDNSSGQLCQKDGPSQHSTPVLFLTSVWSAALEHRKIVASACGNRHTLLLSGSGTVWMVGNCHEVVKLRFESDPLSESSHEDAAGSWRLVKASGTAPIRSISSSNEACGAIDVFGNVWTWTCDDTRPVTVSMPSRATVTAEGLDATAVSVVAAPQRTIVTTPDGNVFTWGHSECGALGLGKSARKAKLPCRIPTLKHVDTVAASDTHTVICCSVLYPAWPFPEPVLAPRPSASSTPAFQFDESDFACEEAGCPDPVKPAEPPSLFALCEKALVKLVTLENVHTLLCYAQMLNTKVLARYCVDTIMLNLDLLLAVGIESRQYFGDDGDASATSLEKLLSEWQFAFRRIVKGELAEGLAPTYLHEPGDVAGVSEARSSAPMAPVKRFKQLRRSFLQATALAVQGCLDPASVPPQQEDLVKQRVHLFRQLCGCVTELEALSASPEVSRCLDQFKDMTASGCTLEALSRERVGSDVVGAGLVARPAVLATTPILTASSCDSIASPETAGDAVKPSPIMKPQSFRDIMSSQATVGGPRRRTSSFSDRPPLSSGVVTPLKDILVKQHSESGQFGGVSSRSPKVSWSSSPVQPEADVLSPHGRAIDFRQLQAEEHQRKTAETKAEAPIKRTTAATVSSPWGFKSSAPSVSTLSSIQAAEADRLAREEAERRAKEEDDRLLAYVMALSASEHDAASCESRKGSSKRGNGSGNGSGKRLQQVGGSYRGTWTPPKKQGT